MYGANYFGQPQYAQGPAIYRPPVTKSVSATVTTTASISRILILNKILSVTVTTTAIVNRTISRTVSATVTTTTSLGQLVGASLKFVSGSTRSLNLDKWTRSVMERATKFLNPETSTINSFD